MSSKSERLATGIAWRRDLLTWKTRIFTRKFLTLLRWTLREPGEEHGLPHEVIVSLTSYPARYGDLAYSLRCLLTQSVQPDRVLLWVAHGDYNLLPGNVLALRKYGLTICTTKDTKSYKKIIPTLLQYPSAAIVTADDDLYYSRDWLRYLTQGSKSFPAAIICHRAHRVGYSAYGVFAPYRSWVSNIPSVAVNDNVFPTTGAGVLYPPKILHDDVLREDLFLKICPTADDIWVYWMGRKSGAPVHKVGPHFKIVEWTSNQGSALNRENVDLGGNDRQLAQLAEYYAPPVSNNEPDVSVYAQKA